MKVWAVRWKAGACVDTLLVNAESHKAALRRAETILVAWRDNAGGRLRLMGMPDESVDSFGAWQVRRNGGATVLNVKSVKHDVSHRVVF